MDDVINVTGHRLGTAEVEDVMVWKLFVYIIMHVCVHIYTHTNIYSHIYFINNELKNATSHIKLRAFSI